MDSSTYAYVLAGDETRALVAQLKGNAARALDALSLYVENLTDPDNAPAGGKVLLTPETQSLKFQFAAAALPPGWELKNGIIQPLEPHRNDEKADIARAKIRAYTQHQNIQARFDEVCKVRAAISVHSNNCYWFEELADKIVVACPPAPEKGIHFVPPDSTAMSYLDYLTMKCALQPPPALTMKPFPR